MERSPCWVHGAYGACLRCHHMFGPSPPLLRALEALWLPEAGRSASNARILAWTESGYAYLGVGTLTGVGRYQDSEKLHPTPKIPHAQDPEITLHVR